MGAASSLPPPDVAPADRMSRSHQTAEDDSGGPVFSGYRGKYGLLKTNIVSSYGAVGLILGGPASKDGVLFLANAEQIADAWIAWGKADPRYMRIVTILWGGPFMTLMIAHAPLAAGIMANHNINVGKFLIPGNITAALQARAAAQQQAQAASGENASMAAVGDIEAPPPLPYQPTGPFAPIDDKGPPPMPDMRIFPDEGIPADVDIQLRQAAQKLKVPYEELREQFLTQVRNEMIAERVKLQHPQTLGQPVTPPGVGI